MEKLIINFQQNFAWTRSANNVLSVTSNNEDIVLIVEHFDISRLEYEDALPQMAVVGDGFFFVYDGSDFYLGGQEPIDISETEVFFEATGDVSKPIYYHYNELWHCSIHNEETDKILREANSMLTNGKVSKIVGDEAVDSIYVRRGAYRGAKFIQEQIIAAK